MDFDGGMSCDQGLLSIRTSVEVLREEGGSLGVWISRVTASSEMSHQLYKAFVKGEALQGNC